MAARLDELAIPLLQFRICPLHLGFDYFPEF